jgi:hypothetical protein
LHTELSNRPTPWNELVPVRELENILELDVMVKSSSQQGDLLDDSGRWRILSLKKTANLLDRKCTGIRGLKMVKQIGKK